MTTYIELTNKALRKLNEAELTSSDFSTARNVQAYAKDCVVEAVRDINNSEFKWPFNYSQYTYTLTAGVQRYAPPSSTRFIEFSTVRLNADSTLGSENRVLKPINYEEWVRSHRINDNTSDSTTWKLPYYCFRYPDDYIGVSGIPDKAYTLTVDRYVIPTDMAAHNDVCNIPSDWDSVILLKALEPMYMFRGNTEQAAITGNKAKAGINNMRTVLLNHAENVTTSYVFSRGNGVGSYFATGYF